MATAGSVRTRTQFVGASADAGDFSDNTTKSVKAVNMRDVIVSLYGRYPIATKTDDYTATDDDCVIVFNNTADKTLTLPAASGRSGKFYIIKRINTSKVTIDGNASETIDGATTQELAQNYQAMVIVCDGSNWHVIGGAN